MDCILLNYVLFKGQEPKWTRTCGFWLTKGKGTYNNRKKRQGYGGKITNALGVRGDGDHHFDGSYVHCAASSSCAQHVNVGAITSSLGITITITVVSLKLSTKQNIYE